MKLGLTNLGKNTDRQFSRTRRSEYLSLKLRKQQRATKALCFASPPDMIIIIKLRTTKYGTWHSCNKDATQRPLKTYGQTRCQNKFDLKKWDRLARFNTEATSALFEHGSELSSSVRRGELPDQFGNYQFLKHSVQLISVRYLLIIRYKTRNIIG